MNKDKIILESIFANSALENNPLTEQEKQRLERLYNGEITFDQFVAELKETLYLNLIPGIAESILAGGQTPIKECLSEDEFDAACADAAYADYVKSGKKTRPVAELWKELEE